jgi:phosphonate transport system substrate-binding protein
MLRTRLRSAARALAGARLAPAPAPCTASSASSAAGRRLASSAPAPLPAAPALPPLVVGLDPAAHPRLQRREESPRAHRQSLVLGTVSYCDAVGSIWKGMMRHFARCGLDVDFVMFTSYERQVAALLAGDIHIAWNGPLAHARAVRLTRGALLPLGMRDVDRDFTTHVIVREGAGIRAVGDLCGRLVASGTVDSPQAYVMPLHALAAAGVDLASLTLTRFDRDVGKHGDTAYGEDGVMEALAAGAVDAGFVSDLMWKRYVAAGKAEGLAVLPGASTSFDHCQFDALPGRLSMAAARRFQTALLSMDGSGHPEDKKTMALEGIRTAWLPARGGALPPPPPPGGKRERGSVAAAAAAAGGALPDARVGYEGMLAALESTFKEPPLRWPGVLHTPRRHPFKHLMVDAKLILDTHGC